jgi:hypothetical protein
MLRRTLSIFITVLTIIHTSILSVFLRALHPQPTLYWIFPLLPTIITCIALYIPSDVCPLNPPQSLCSNYPVQKPQSHAISRNPPPSKPTASLAVFSQLSLSSTPGFRASPLSLLVEGKPLPYVDLSTLTTAEKEAWAKDDTSSQESETTENRNHA